jgi:protein gp37
MGENSGIQWTTHTMNPWLGCERISAECDHCYAERGSKRLAAQHGLKLWDDGSTRYVTSESYWKQPLRWNRAAEAAGERARVFCASYSDVFEDRAELRDVRNRLFLLIDKTPWLDWLLLTKRPENMVPLTPRAWRTRWPANIWAGTTVGVASSLHRVRELEQVPAVIRFLSMEPLLELVIPDLTAIDWAIVGGESGPKARPFDIVWARQLRYACEDAGTAYFFKQAGSKPFEGSQPLLLKDSHGGNLDEIPEDLCIREFPKPAAKRAFL